MTVFSHRSFDDHQSVHFHADGGLKAIIAIHNTVRGPAVGGCRMWPYGDDDAALTDALRLSYGMTLKSALAEMPFGGGKSIVIGDPARDKSPALWRAMGRFVESLGGRYIVAEDVGTSPADMEIIRRETRFVAGIEEGGSGDPSPATAWGVFMGIKAALETRFGRGDPSGVRVAPCRGWAMSGWRCADCWRKRGRCWSWPISMPGLSPGPGGITARHRSPPTPFTIRRSMYFRPARWAPSLTTRRLHA